MVRDTNIVLGHVPRTRWTIVRPNYELSDQGKARVEKAVFLSTLYRTLTMSGGNAEYWELECDGSLLMENHAASFGIARERILREGRSRDTVGNLLISKLLIAKPQNWTKIGITTNDYHMTPRVEEIAWRIFGQGYDIEFHPVTVPAENPNTPEKEERSLEVFRRMFGHVRDGDDEHLLHVLFEQHPCYNKDEELKRKFGERN